MTDDIFYITDTFKANNFECYVVGGWVRDLYLEKGTGESDIDFATNALPEQVITLFEEKGHTVIPTGIEHGTVTVIINTVGFEITTYRKDISCDGRNATVEFANDIEEDLKRRDFTFNALAISPVKKSINIVLDYFGGMNDIKKKVIKTVGNPFDRFQEDYLRVFRALRFATVYDDFIIDGWTWNAIVSLSKETNYLDVLSVERIKMEIDKVFKKSDRPSVFFVLLRNAGILEQLFPELEFAVGFEQNKHHSDDLFNHTMFTLDSVPKEYPLLRWVALLHDLGKLYNLKYHKDGSRSFAGHEDYSVMSSEKILDKFKFSTKDKTYILHLIQNHMRTIPVNSKNSAVRRFILAIGEEYFNDFLIFKRADRMGNRRRNVKDIDEDISYIKNRVDEVLKSATEAPVRSYNQLEVNGHDICYVRNIEPGPEVGRVLKALYDEVVENPGLNQRQLLLRRIKEI